MGNKMTLIATDITTVAGMPVWWPDFSIGIFFVLLGFVGAGIMVFLGEWDKLLGRSARILELEEEINSKRKIAEKLTDKEDINTRKDWEDRIDKDENRMAAERNLTTYIGIVLYIFIGGMLASVIANNPLQAVAVGAGWTALLGTFGIKKDSDERREIRGKKDDELLGDWNDVLNKKTDNAYKTGYKDALEELKERLG